MGPFFASDGDSRMIRNGNVSVVQEEPLCNRCNRHNRHDTKMAMLPSIRMGVDLSCQAEGSCSCEQIRRGVLPECRVSLHA